MKVFAAVLLSISLAAVPLLANSAKEAAKEDPPAAPSSAPPKAVEPKEPAKSEDMMIEDQLQDLRGLVQNQMQQLEAQRAAMKVQQQKIEALEEKLRATNTPLTTGDPAAVAPSATSTAAVAPTPSSSVAAADLTPASSITPVEAVASAPAVAPASPKPPQQAAEERSPLYFKIGRAEFYPLGFMDMMGVFRTTNVGGLGTSFGGIPFNNSAPAGRLSEFRFSTQNSRVGLRTHAKFGQADVTGYLEADFLGYLPPNGNDTSNSNSLRMRLYWVDYRRGKIEVLGGQSWSFLTPNRVGLSAMPGDLFYSQDVDTNYQLGLTWARQTTFRVIAHPTKDWAIGVSLENPQQTLPGSVALPSGITGNYNNQFDTNSGNTSSSTAVNNPNVPNLHPDIIVKTAFDAQPGGHHVHFDVAGLFRSFKAVNLITPGSGATPATNTIHGGGIAATINLELVKNLRLITTGYYSYAGGRYIGSTGGPDLIVKADGSLSGVHSGSGIGGLEFQPNSKTVIYAYYSGAYFGKNVAGITTSGTTNFFGYGYPGSSNSANRYLYEPTFGVHYMFWHNPMYGDLRLMTQYSYVSRTPWSVAPGSPKTAHNSMVYIDLRYDLP